MILPYTVFPQTQWPAIPSPFAAGVLGVLFQLEHTQWLPPTELAAHQQRQLKLVLEHAYRTVPFYRQRLDAIDLTPDKITSDEDWLRIPLLQRRDVQIAGSSLHSSDVPNTHGKVAPLMTSGSTGQPVVTLTTELTEFFWRVLTLRDHVWHRRDLNESFASIRFIDSDRSKPPLGTRVDSWGAGARDVAPTGPGYLLSVKSTVEEQATWLHELNPGYVLAYPSVLLAITRLFEARGWSLPRLRGILTFGEILESECRTACERYFNAKVTDTYSSQEVGYIALQCPEHHHYHVQSESVLAEILDDTGRPCQPGQVGKVVVTSLHNFAMPLVRYNIGDYAEVGEACPCGRGLPVLKRILGRQRNLLVMPSGQRYWPVITPDELPDNLPPFFQYQLVQRSLEEIELNVVGPGPGYTEEEQITVERCFQKALGYPFKITIRRVSEIPRSATGKFEDFISHVP